MSERLSGRAEHQGPLHLIKCVGDLAALAIKRLLVEGDNAITEADTYGDE